MIFKPKKNATTMFASPPPPPPTKEVAKISTMLSQLQTWIDSGETELAAKHWNLISEECRRYAAGNKL